MQQLNRHGFVHACTQLKDTPLLAVCEQAFSNHRQALLSEMTNPLTSVTRLQQLQMLGAGLDSVEELLQALANVPKMKAKELYQFAESLNLQLLDPEDDSND